MTIRHLQAGPAALLTLLLLLSACSKEQSTGSATPVGSGRDPAGAASADGIDEAVTAAGQGESEGESLEELTVAGTIELRQYTVAYVGSGTMGGGTLTVDGVEHPFRIAGLGIGGIGASALDAAGTVYNLPELEAFPGTYGTARLGMTAGESGGGKLWLRNPDGVVIELESEMRGLALAGGVDGIYIEWDDGETSDLDRVREGSEEVMGGAIEAGADAVESGVNKVKGWLKKSG